MYSQPPTVHRETKRRCSTIGNRQRTKLLCELERHFRESAWLNSSERIQQLNSDRARCPITNHFWGGKPLPRNVLAVKFHVGYSRLDFNSEICEPTY